MNYGNLTERLGRDDLQMIEDVQQYLINNKNLKGDARTSAEGIMNSTFGDMQELETAYNQGGAEAGAEYVLDNLPKAAIKKYLNESMQELNEKDDVQTILDTLEDCVKKSGKDFHGIGKQLKRCGIKYTYSDGMMPMYRANVDGHEFGIINKKYVDKGDREVGSTAIGLMESLEVLNEGQFSWFTHDTDQQIGSEKENTINVWMYDNEGNSWYEDRYEGYGVFGGMDYYDLLAKMNGYTDEDLEDYKGTFKEMRSIGIDLAFGELKTKHKGRKTLFPALSGNGRYNWKRHDFTKEAESDPNQSWYQEEYYENKHVPSYLKFVNENLKK